MPDKVTSAKTGKTYEVPESWTDKEVDDYIKGQEKSLWEKATTPLATKPSEVGAKVEQDITDPSLSDADHPYAAMAKGFIGGAAHGLGDMMSSATSPLSLAALLASGGASAAEGAGMSGLAAGARIIPKIIGTGAAGHGALNILQGIREGNLGNIGAGGLEMATGASALHAPEVIQPSEPIQLPKPNPTPILDESGRPVAPPQPELARPNGPWDANGGNGKPQFPVNDPLQTMQDRAEMAFGKPSGPMSKVDLLNASAVADHINPNKVQIRLGKDGTYELMNPTKDLDAAIKAGYEPVTGALNKDGSLTVRSKPGGLNAVAPIGNAAGLNDVAPLSAPDPTAGIPSFKSRPLEIGGGNNGGNLPPTQQPSLPFPEPIKKPGSVNASDLINLPRSAMAGADLSAPLRQGGFMITRPQFWTSLRPMMKAAMSEDGYNSIMQNIQSKPTYQLAQNSGLSLTDLNELREEHIMSPIPERIPGPIGAIYRGSNRAYTAFLDKLRMDTFDSLATDAMKSGLDMRKSGPAIANYINTATGRGALPKSLEQSAKAINGLFFSPRFMASRVRLLGDPNLYLSADPIVRQAAWRDLAGFSGTVSATLGLAHMMGADVTIDPTNPDFGKLKVGNTRIDMLAGFGPYVKLFGQLAAMQKTSSVTGKVTKLNSGKFGGKTGLDVVNDFINSKEAPIPSFASDALRGKETSGAPFSPIKGVAERLVPMMLQDFYDIYKDDPKHLPLGVPGIFGAGVQTYGSNNFQRSRAPNSIQRIH